MNITTNDPSVYYQDRDEHVEEITFDAVMLPRVEYFMAYPLLMLKIAWS
ncbi:MAG: hypothetical protein MI976_23940 [Pseudomonadales bacterium]|nr:hypothetical protein [Pseudomonadales bacterium]